LVKVGAADDNPEATIPEKIRALMNRIKKLEEDRDAWTDFQEKLSD